MHTARELSGIFGLIDQLQAVDTKTWGPLAHLAGCADAFCTALREDRATEANAREANMANAPEVEDGLFRAQVIE